MPPAPAQSPEQKVNEYERYFEASSFKPEQIEFLLSQVREFKRGFVTILWDGKPRKTIDTSKVNDAGELAMLLMREIDAFLLSLTEEEHASPIEPTFTDKLLQ